MQLKFFFSPHGTHRRQACWRTKQDFFLSCLRSTPPRKHGARVREHTKFYCKLRIFLSFRAFFKLRKISGVYLFISLKLWEMRVFDFETPESNLVLHVVLERNSTVVVIATVISWLSVFSTKAPWNSFWPLFFRNEGGRKPLGNSTCFVHSRYAAKWYPKPFLVQLS